ncbi:histidinol-phosphate transaminase [Demequina oxidasica]|uniref:histidinol-phosphate transaminase n=1 Tax=Demequina oxidasica TaxID=676199 RepID=UPI0007851E4F|nr:histidinol-phosphate transaminase [Demequina oxidasica]
MSTPPSAENSAPTPRSVIGAMPRYVPGARGALDAAPPIKLSSNEVPFGPLPSVAEAITRAGGAVNRYPDAASVELHARLAAHVGVSDANVATGGGSVAVLAHVLQAYCDAGDQVIYAWRSFEAYPIISAISGVESVQVPNAPDGRHDLVAMAAAVTDRTKVVILCSPNNPTGPSIRHDEFETFMAAVPRRVLVVLDEAYVEFVRNSETVNGPRALERHPNLILVRTFSKAYGLAGLRIGYAVGPEELIAPVRACVTTFSVSSIAQIAAVASLDATDELLERVAQVVAERERVVPAVRELGFAVPDADGNFFWLPVGDDAVRLAQGLGALEPSVLVRPFAGDGVRVTIGTAAENDALLGGLASFREQR